MGSRLAIASTDLIMSYTSSKPFFGFRNTSHKYIPSKAEASLSEGWFIAKRNIEFVSEYGLILTIKQGSKFLPDGFGNIEFTF